MSIPAEEGRAPAPHVRARLGEARATVLFVTLQLLIATAIVVLTMELVAARMTRVVHEQVGGASRLLAQRIDRLEGELEANMGGGQDDAAAMGKTLTAEIGEIKATLAVLRSSLGNLAAAQHAWQQARPETRLPDAGPTAPLEDAALVPVPDVDGPRPEMTLVGLRSRDGAGPLANDTWSDMVTPVIVPETGPGIVPRLKPASLPTQAMLRVGASPAGRLRRPFVVQQDVYFRTGPGLGFGIGGALRNGQVILADEYREGWHGFITEAGTRGYVFEDWLRPARPSD